jgi:hypothetical protein
MLTGRKARFSFGLHHIMTCGGPALRQCNTTKDLCELALINAPAPSFRSAKFELRYY